MKTSRRNFLRSAALVGCASTMASNSFAQAKRPPKTDYARLDKVLEQPVLKRELFPDPVMIESVELLRDRNNFLCRVRSTDGAEGVSVGHPFISKQSYPVFVRQAGSVLHRQGRPGSRSAHLPHLRVERQSPGRAVLRAACHAGVRHPRHAGHDREQAGGASDRRHAESGGVDLSGTPSRKSSARRSRKCRSN